MVVVLQRSAKNISGRWHTYNRAPESGEDYLWACKYLQIRDTGVRGLNFPLPLSRNVRWVRFDGGGYTLGLEDAKVNLTIHQIHQTCVKAINANGLTDEELERIFDRSSSLPPDEPPPPLHPEKTKITHLGWGRLEYSPSVRWFEGRYRLGTRRFKVTFGCDRQGSADAAIKRSEVLLPVLRQTIERAKHYAATELVELQHDWAEGQQPELDENGFARKLKLRSIHFDETGRTEFWFADSNMFYGHDVRVVMDANDDFTDAGIEG